MVEVTRTVTLERYVSAVESKERVTVVKIGMHVLDRAGLHIGSVAQVLPDVLGVPPGLIITMPTLFGLRRRRVTLTTFDVRDVRAATVLLRITRWDANNRAS